VSFIGAFLANRNSIILQTRKLKEDQYISFVELLHNHSANNTTESLEKYVLIRDKMLLIASEDVVNKMLAYEKNGVGKSLEDHDIYLTELIKSIRRDLKLKDKKFPLIGFKKARKDKMNEEIESVFFDQTNINMGRDSMDPPF
ncbi:MAG: hypothetical protein AAF617_11205, partial [Bacteroidota bacterium]